MKKPYFEENYIYHIYNRGVEKRNIFLEDKDYFRFIHNLFELNNANRVINTNYYFKGKNIEVQPRYTQYIKKEARKLLVEILAFVLMPNHFHLLLKQKREKGIPKFMQKIGTGCTMYFNQKYDRVGGLFQGRFKAKLVDKDYYLVHLLNYIHFNPLGLKYRGSTSIDLKEYRWSSFLDYVGKRNFPSLTSRDFLLKSFFGSSEEKYKKEAEEWLKEKDRNISFIKDIILE